MVMNIKKQLFIISLLPFSLFSFCQTSETFRQWGEESLTVIDTYLRASKGIYLYAEKSSSGQPAYAWPTGIQIKALTHAGRTKDAENLMNDFHSNYYTRKNNYYGYTAGYKESSSSNRYYDDNAWIIMDLMELYSITKKTDYLSRAKEVMKLCMSGESPLGGIMFNERDWVEGSTDYLRWRTCATAPTAYANLQIYQVTNETSYLTNGQRLYDFMKQPGNWGIGPGYRGYENAVIMRVALLLYQITEEQKYLDDTYQLAYSMQTQYISRETGRLDETGQWGGHDMTDAYVDLYNFDKNPKWLNIVARYLVYLHDNCKNATGFYTEEWNGAYEDGFDREQLLYQASAASSFMRLANTPVSVDSYTEPVAIFQATNYNRDTQSKKLNTGLNVGSYTRDDLLYLGWTDSKFNFKAELSSIQIADGYKVTLYQEGYFSGASKIMYRSSANLGEWNKTVKSIKIESLSTAVKDIQETEKIRLYPTVVKDLLYIENLKANSILEIINLSGVTLLKDIVSGCNHMINVERLPNGIYLCQVSNDGKSQVIKFTKTC
jgi:hypothetical protein